TDQALTWSVVDFGGFAFLWCFGTVSPLTAPSRRRGPAAPTRRPDPTRRIQRPRDARPRREPRAASPRRVPRAAPAPDGAATGSPSETPALPGSAARAPAGMALRAPRRRTPRPAPDGSRP